VGSTGQKKRKDRGRVGVSKDIIRLNTKNLQGNQRGVWKCTALHTYFGGRWVEVTSMSQSGIGGEGAKNRRREGEDYYCSRMAGCFCSYIF